MGNKLVRELDQCFKSEKRSCFEFKLTSTQIVKLSKEITLSDDAFHKNASEKNYRHINNFIIAHVATEHFIAKCRA